ncbi:hypothetical protein AYJ54_07945 [Bradyrhizobium centrolobii]|uniref:Uncharacterized protein n=1 Tax=Bradyrhizobium centrolobii TaxID=1505087 RepID=A0A176YYC6_9BRAD|nr:PC4/YdbC family ssDNA-binding protein [Bradyrhizobium centrolobii]OAF11783.1 hypothetical protein AYJ54_07945 [Bradyrhizobium centrolobii]
MAVADQSARSNAPLDRGEEHETAKLWADRSGNAVIAKLVQLDGKWYFDLRRYFTNPQGKFTATKKGVMVSVRKLPDLVKAVGKSEREAIRLGFLKSEDAE